MLARLRGGVETLAELAEAVAAAVAEIATATVIATRTFDFPGVVSSLKS